MNTVRDRLLDSLTHTNLQLISVFSCWKVDWKFVLCRFFGNRSYCHERLGQFDK